jgi:predicted DNA-binding transcriptional regulator AlpA
MTHVTTETEATTTAKKARKRALRQIPSDPWTLLSAADIERLLGVNRITLWRWHMAGRFPQPDKVLGGGRKYWLRSTYERWLTGVRS